MYNDPTCDTCHDMIHNSEYGVEEPHQAHCSIDHDKGEHYTMVSDNNDIITLKCDCCEEWFATSSQDRQVGYSQEENVYWCLPCNTETCGSMGATCTELRELEAQFLADEANAEYYDAMHNAANCKGCGKYDTLADDYCFDCASSIGVPVEEFTQVVDEEQELEDLRHEQLIKDSMDMLKVIEDIMNEGK